MKKYLVPVLLILLIVLNFGRLHRTQASLNSTSITKVSVRAASLDFKLDGNNHSLKIDLGEVKPGDSGTVDIKVSTIGDVSGSLCIKDQNLPPGFAIQSTKVCGVEVAPDDSIQFEINWSLPVESHNTGLDGTDFQFSYEFTLVNGYIVTKHVILKGTIIDPIDPTSTPTPTPTPTDTVTVVVTETVTETSVPEVVTTTPTVTETVIETVIESVTETPTLDEIILTDTEVPPEATEIIDTPVPIEDIPTDIPIEATDVPQE